MNEKKVDYYSDAELKKINKKRIKKRLKRIGIGVAIGVAGIVGYKTGYYHARNNSFGILSEFLKENPELGKELKTTWNASVDKYFGKK